MSVKYLVRMVPYGVWLVVPLLILSLSTTSPLLIVMCISWSGSWRGAARARGGAGGGARGWPPL